MEKGEINFNIMLTKTKTINEKENDLETNHSFSIPENIQKNINEK
ncbi:hypothetical protein ACFLY2_01115 [Patescibacteria group bacterium]